MSNQAVAKLLWEILKGAKPPKRIQIFLASGDSTSVRSLFMDDPKWEGAAPPGGAIVSNDPSAIDPQMLAGWRVVIDHRGAKR